MEGYREKYHFLLFLCIHNESKTTTSLCYTSRSERRNRTEQNRTNMSNTCQKFIVKLASGKCSLKSINYRM